MNSASFLVLIAYFSRLGREARVTLLVWRLARQKCPLCLSRDIWLQTWAGLLPEVIFREVIRIETLQVLPVELIHAQVIEYLPPPAKIDLHSAENILNQVREGISRILLVVQIFHSTPLLESFRSLSFYLVYE